MPIDESGFWVPPNTVDPNELKIPHPPEYSYRDPIPEATTVTPAELLTKYYGDKGSVRDWTDPRGVLWIQQLTHRRYPKNAILPIGSAGLVGKWPRPEGLLAVPVPVYGADPHRYRPCDIVEFRSQAITKRASKGVSFKNILRGTPSVMEGADKSVIDKFRHGRRLDFIVAWPGYPPELSEIFTLQGADGKSLTRHELALQIVERYSLFFEKVEKLCVFPNEPGFYNIALHQGDKAKEDSLGVQFMQLHLVRFQRVEAELWIAHVDIA